MVCRIPSSSRRRWKEPGYVRAGITVLFLVGCKVHQVELNPSPPVNIPTRYSFAEATDSADFDGSAPWWTQYHDAELDSLMQRALIENFSEKSALLRITKAEADYRRQFGHQLPALSLNAGAFRSRTSTRGNVAVDGESTDQSTTESDYTVGPSLSYEVDLWRRLNSLSNAEFSSYQATQADAENATLLLSGKVAEYVFRIREYQALLALLTQQLTTGRTLLDLTELRFRVGKGSALDVYQQRQQLQATQSEVPRVKSQLEQAKNTLATLLGQSPEELSIKSVENPLPALPPFPRVASPATLMASRPDLRSLQRQVASADFALAAAIADRLPSLQVSFSYLFNAAALGDLLSTTVSTLAGETTTTLLGNGDREAAVRSHEAALNILRNDFADAFLVALQDVESAIAAERYQQELCANLDQQLKNAQATLDEARARYLQGLTDYLQVVVAIQALQGLERQVISERRELLLSRNRLYLALGGGWTTRLIDHGGSP